MFFLQALQIDVEKWRHVYMMLGMVWALEAARLRTLHPSLTLPLPRRIAGHPDAASRAGTGGPREGMLGGGHESFGKVGS
jgi:hypothetical protein